MADLAAYIKNIHYGDDFLSQIFDYGVAHQSPHLQFGRINRILLYPGCFNPPHRGHFELLCHGKGKCGRDMCIIAAIVLPLDDESLVWKLRDQENPLIFHKDERVRLWKGHVPGDWYWMYDRSISEWYGFQERLTQAITKDGFDVRWVLLCGPDHVKVNEVPQLPLWGCQDIIVSNVGRPAEFVSPTGNKLKMLAGYEAWEGITPDLKALQRYAKESTAWVYSGIFMISPIHGQCILDEDPDCIERMVEHFFNDAVEEGKAIKICRRKDGAEGTVRFIPTKSRMTDMSSTRIREIIKLAPPQEQLLKELQQLVLYPKILLELISRKS
ncbi:hypothetical protein V8E51_018560 [Hyaloscypha variabilis]